MSVGVGVADVDECSEGWGMPACGELEQCNNVPGSYHCTCNTGFPRLHGQCTGEALDSDRAQVRLWTRTGHR